jgi:hypothetical protein
MSEQHNSDDETGLYFARPARKGATISSTLMPCASTIASLQPSRDATSSSARRPSGLGPTWRMRGIHVRVSQRPRRVAKGPELHSSWLEEVVRLSSGLGGRDATRDIVGRERVRQTREGSLVSEPQKRMRGAPKGRKRRSETGSTSGIGTTAAHLSKTFGLAFPLAAGGVSRRIGSGEARMPRGSSHRRQSAEIWISVWIQV